MGISELREVARSRGLKGWTALRKNDMREFLINNGTKPSTSRTKRLSVAERFAKQSTLASEDLLDRIKKLEKENNELRQQQTVPTLPPPLEPNPINHLHRQRHSRNLRTKAKAANDWLVSHVPEPISTTSRITRQILSRYHSTSRGSLRSGCRTLRLETLWGNKPWKECLEWTRPVS